MTDNTDAEPTAEEVQAADEFAADLHKAAVCPGCGKVHEHNMNPRLTAVLDKVEALDEERKNLLTDRLLLTIAEGLKETAKMPAPPEVMMAVTVLANLTNLAGYTLGSVAVGHEDWTRTGDKVVNALLTEYLTLIDESQIHEDDLPEGTAVRLKNGIATAEDYDAIRALLKEKTGEDPGEITADSDLLKVVGGEGAEDENDHYVAPPDMRYL
jgi:hypothetical protein